MATMHNAKHSHGLLAYAAAAFFVLMLSLPTTFQLERGVFLAALVMGGVVAALYRWRVSREILWLWLITLAFGAFGICYGLLNGAPGAIRVATVYLLWPCVYMVFVGLTQSHRTVIFFEKALLCGIAVASIMALMLIFGALMGQGRLIAELLAFQGAGVGIYQGFIELRLLNLTTLVYGLPFLFALFIAPRSHSWMPNRVWIGVLLLVVMAVCVLSGRRAFWLLALMTPLIVGGLYLWAAVSVNRKTLFGTMVFVALLAVVGAVAIGLEFDALIEQFRAAFDFSGEVSAGLRYAQFIALMEGWADAPFLGHGFGSFDKTLIRSVEMPWSYELSYVALLFHTGILGFAVYSLAVFWVFFAGVRIVRLCPEAAQVMLPLLAGLAGILVVNATNPYLSKFDYLWTIFLPVAAINAYRVSK